MATNKVFPDFNVTAYGGDLSNSMPNYALNWDDFSVAMCFKFIFKKNGFFVLTFYAKDNRTYKCKLSHKRKSGAVVEIEQIFNNTYHLLVQVDDELIITGGHVESYGRVTLNNCYFI